MKSSWKALLVVALTLSLFAPSAQAAPVVDQSFTSPNTLTTLINECCKFVAQTFTAGRSGVLTGVNINVMGFTSSQLHIAIRTVAEGHPTSTVLGETVLGSNSAPLSQLITFPEEILITAGHQYAIVVNYDGAPPAGPGQAQGFWFGAVGDVYPRGAVLLGFPGSSWISGPGFDAHFQTYVEETAGILTGLRDAVQGLGPGTSLADKLNDAQAALDSNDVAATCSILRALVNEVKAQSGKKIPTGTAVSLISEATRIRAVLSC